MARLRKQCPPTASEQLEALLGYPWPFPGRPPKHDLSTWTVTDDWPEHIPVTEAEVNVFEAWFGEPEIEGRFGYTDDFSGFNHERRLAVCSLDQQGIAQ